MLTPKGENDFDKPHPDDLWSGIDRRARMEDSDLDILTKREFEERLAAFRLATADAINSRFELLEKRIIEKLEELNKTLLSGFPNGDPVEHRKDHETSIKLDNDKKELYKNIREKVITSAVWGMVVMIGLAVWEYIKVGLNK